ncbi:MAG: ATP-binding protein [Ferruginibacter sp.]
MLVFFVTTVLNFICELYLSALVTLSAVAFSFLIGHFIKKQQYREAHFGILLLVNISLLLINVLEGTNAGGFMFFFAFIVSLGYLTNPSDKKKFQLTYLVTSITFLVTLFFVPAQSTFQLINPASALENFRYNSVLAFALLCWMSYVLVKETGRQHTELQSGQEFLDTIFNSSLHADIIVDIQKGSISHCNDQAALLFALSVSDKLEEQNLESLFTPSILGGKQYFMQTIFDPAKSWKGELVCNRINGTNFPAEVSMVAFSYGGITYKKISIMDITEKNRMMQELRVAKQRAEESAEIKTRFLSNMSHELRTPLNGIIGTTNLLLQEKHLKTQGESLNVLKYSSEHMHRVINDILDLSKLDADKIELEKIEVDIPGLIHRVSHTFKKQYRDKGLEFEVEQEGPLEKLVMADPTRLSQVLSNLLSNALKFTDAGRVTLSIKALDIDANNKYIHFSVKDSGIGIGAEKQKLIFDPFTQADLKTTRKYGGTGLGLTISRKLVALMGGELKVESTENKGSEFHFNINFQVAKESARSEIKSVPAMEKGRLNGLKVLIAEDNPVNLLIATKFMDKWGVSYTTAKNGLEAVNKFPGDEFDVILMDIEMPEMDGYAALAEIRKQNNSVPILAFTAGVFENMKEKMESAGFEGYIRKPFKPEELSSKLLEISERRVKRA